ncbi:hypothetical protein [Photobacterium aquae]|uniref:hypothetical protein n=1 Tax=Photobacterium aquae TaxID=1195763 RepID=UPI000A5442B1|nr:hypothetical protein [Photobacterium aquae]
MHLNVVVLYCRRRQQTEKPSWLQHVYLLSKKLSGGSKALIKPLTMMIFKS